MAAPSNRIVSEISLLYELALATGQTLDLKENCDCFLKVLMARKNLAYTAVWIRNRYLPKSLAEPAGEEGAARLVYAHPQFRRGDEQLSATHPLLDRLACQGPFSLGSGQEDFARLATEKGIRRGAFAVFPLGAVGLLKIISMQRDTPFSATEMNQLRNVISKFAISLEGCLAHRQLVEEIAERKRWQTEMEKLSNAIRQTADGVVITDREGRIEYVNPAVEKLTGYAREELIGQTPRLFKSGHHPPEFYRNLWTTILAGQIHRATFVNRARDGGLIHVEHTITPIRDASGRITSFVSVWKDISERLRQEEEKARLEEKLRQAQKLEAVGQLTAGIAHNFNNMLMALLNNLEMAQMEGVHDPSLLREAESIALRAAEMVEQLMVFSRAERPVAAEPVAVGEVVERTISLCRRTFDRKIAIHAHLPDGLPFVRGDANQLEQVFLNLLLNARDALEERQPMAPHIWVRAGEVMLGKEDLLAQPQALPGPYLRLQVADNGAGISPEVLPRIFEPFFTTKGVDRGTGLGLATVYAILHEHRGWIECDSQPGKGTTFSIFLPAAMAQDPLEPQPQVVAEDTGGSETILVVEDEESVRRGLVSTLKRRGYATLAATDGLAALELFRRERGRIALVLLDLSLPGLSGREVLAQIRALEPACPVVLSTGFAANEVEDLAVQALLEKPYRMTAALQTIRRVLDRGTGNS